MIFIGLKKLKCLPAEALAKAGGESTLNTVPLGFELKNFQKP
jgi:hypothetical protein